LSDDVLSLGDSALVGDLDHSLNIPVGKLDHLVQELVGQDGVADQFLLVLQVVFTATSFSPTPKLLEEISRKNLGLVQVLVVRDLG